MSPRETARLRLHPPRGLRCDAHRWVRPDCAKFLKPGADPAAVYPALATDPRRRAHQAHDDAQKIARDQAALDAILAEERAALDAMRSDLLAIKSDLAFKRFMTALTARKYSASQPRVPRGNGRPSGRWTDGHWVGEGRPRVYITGSTSEGDGDGGTADTGDDGGIDGADSNPGFDSPSGSYGGNDTGATTSTSPSRTAFDLGDVSSEVGSLGLFNITPLDNTITGGVQLAGDPDQLPEIVVTPGEAGETGQPGTGHNGGPPLEDPPEIPRTRPRRGKQRTARQRALSSWIGRAIKAGATSRLKLLFAAIKKFVSWLLPFLPQIITYLDPPRTLEELQRAVATHRLGTDVDHMAERKALELEGYSAEQINAPENLVRIPRLKHHEITGWYQKPNKSFGGMTPRQYLVGKPFSEKLRIKREALILFKVLKK